MKEDKPSNEAVDFPVSDNDDSDGDNDTEMAEDAFELAAAPTDAPSLIKSCCNEDDNDDDDQDNTKKI